MSTLEPAYRLTVFAPRSVDPTEATILTPVAGAPHSDQFKVATLPLAGWKPYLYFPGGRTGKIDVLSRNTDIGVVTISLMDARLAPPDNLTRWLTAFFGNLKGEYRAGGLRALLEESIDQGATWAAWFTGRLQKVSSHGKPLFTLEIQDEASEFTQSLFVGRPHSSISYASTLALAPIGLVTAVGSLPAVKPFSGTVAAFSVGTYVYPFVVQLNLDVSQISTRPELLITTNLLASMTAPVILNGGMPNALAPGRARLTHTSGAHIGQTGDYLVGVPIQLGGGVGTPADKQGHSRLTALLIQELPNASDANYLQLPAAGVTVTGYVYSSAPISPENPLIVDLPSGPIAFLQDIVNGKFGFIWRSPETLPPGKAYGDVKRAYAVNAGNFAPFLADATYPPVRFVLTAPDQMGTWIQENLLKPYSLAMFVDASAQINLIDLRLPASLAGIPTLTDADLVDATDTIAWTFDRAQAISRVDASWFSDQVVGIDNLVRSADRFPMIAAGLLQPIEHKLILLAVGSGDFGDKIYQLVAAGYRAMDGEALNGQPRATYLMGKLQEHMSSLRRPFAQGASIAAIRFRRTANVPRVPGGLFLLQVSALPDPSTNKRGGTRLCRATQVDFANAALLVSMLDLGVGVVSSAPSATQPAQEANNTSVGVTTTVTIGNGPAELRFAVTATSVGSAPPDTDPSWTMAAGVNPIAATGAVTFRPGTPGQRIWVQVRTFMVIGTVLQLPSAWVLAGGNGRVDLAAWPAPSVLTKTLDTGRSFRLGWTNGATDLLVQVLLRTPVGDPPTLIDTLPAGSVQKDLIGVDPATTYRCGVRYYDGRNAGPEVTADFTTGASSATSPAMAGVSVLV